MSFTLRVWFSGLCHFITNSAEGEARSFRQLCVVLPDARDPEVGTPHRAVMSVPIREKLEKGRFRILYDKSGKLDLIALDGRRVSVFLSEPVGSVDPLYFNFSLDSAIFLPDIAGSFADESGEIVANRKTDGVLAQVVFDRGLFGVDPLAAVTSDWILPGTLSGQSKVVTLAEPKYIDVPVRDEVRLMVHDLEGDLVREWVIQEGDTDLHEVMISNRCDDGKALLEWRVEGEHLRVFQLDEDFIHHYQLLSPAVLQSLNQHDRVVEKIAQGDALIYPVPERLLLDLDLGPFLMGEPWKGAERGRFRLALGDDEKGETKVELDGLEGLGLEHVVWSEDLIGLLPKDLMRTFRWAKELLRRAIGSGSGCDCLGCGGRFRFLDEKPTTSRVGAFGGPAADLVGRTASVAVEVDRERRTRSLRVATPVADSGGADEAEGRAASAEGSAS